MDSSNWRWRVRQVLLLLLERALKLKSTIVNLNRPQLPFKLNVRSKKGGAGKMGLALLVGGILSFLCQELPANYQLPCRVIAKIIAFLGGGS